jgi:hypothetical protein
MDLTNYEFKQPKKLFGTENAKTTKGEKLGYHTFIIYMSPDKQNTKGKTVCSNSTEGCRIACLFTAGMGIFSNVMLGRLHKTEYFLRDRKAFMEQVAKEIKAGIKKHGADKICIRLNGTSDIPYENIPVGEYPNIMTMFPDVQFYDYTKIFSRLDKTKLPANYHLTFSRAETALNQKQAELALQLGFNVAAVFNVKDETELPTEYKGAKVVNGDEHDLTFIQPEGVILGLKAKGKAKKDTTGFVIRDFK